MNQEMEDMFVRKSCLIKKKLEEAERVGNLEDQVKLMKEYLDLQRAMKEACECE